MVSALPPGGARAVARCDELGVAPYSDLPDSLYRGYLTPAHRAALDRVGAWMVEAGMQIRIDPAANLIGRYEGLAPDPPALIIASHIDSVRDGGRYDGPLGIMLGIEAVAALQGRRLPFAIEVIAFGDEEGSRFPAAMLTSRAVAGTLDASALDMIDAHGISVAEALAEMGLDVVEYLTAARAPGTALAYLEAHIEQGPLLEAEGLAVGTVTGIAAQLRYEITVTGTAGHAGTTSMPLRRDALAGAAEMILAVETIAGAAASDLVATVGRIEASPGAANVIPGSVTFTLDVRAGDPTRRDEAAADILEAIRAIAGPSSFPREGGVPGSQAIPSVAPVPPPSRGYSGFAQDGAGSRNLDVAITLIHDLPASPCDPALMDLLDAATTAAGHPIRRLVSGAGHDAMVMAALCPTAMLFIRCRGGISHNPAEHVDPADAEIALAVMSGFIDRLGATLDPA
ncbi:allantoate deiminase [Sphingomonas sp. PP-CE-3G-477]|uniref:Zn-dependent hydrolase n=1 Tax=Sphingomonas sp. PP-CE-3G-477 TaxID=2135660 RepID=UPI000D36B12B|nr:Zn-dependent hydrolase [Sphingomonas sp. PP-CE-3G-477]PTQ64970.1 allantoate deiminase [Sphingomonas sp. PP-CE-3G-477]